MVVWLVTLAVLGALIYLNLVGLPDFLKRPLLSRLAEHGMSLEFAALKLHWSRGFVAEQVRFGASSVSNNPALPQLSAAEVEFNFHLRALVLAKVQVDSIAMRGGKLVWTLAESNAPPRRLTIENIETSVRLLVDDRWVLDDFRAQFGGANFFLSGTLKNASALRDQKIEGEAAHWPERLRKMAEILDQITFTAPPEFRLDLNGDARDLGSFDALFSVKAAAADTAWGRGKQAVLTTRLYPAGSNELSRVEMSLLAQQVETRWANTTNLDVKLRLVTAAAHPDLVDAAATVRVAGVESPWAMVKDGQVKATWKHAITNPIPRSARIELQAGAVTTFMTRFLQVNFSGALDCATNPPATDAALGFWNHLLPYQVTWSGSVGLMRSLFLQAENISATGEWTPPNLSVANLRAQLYRGSLAADAQVNVQSRAVSCRAATDFDLQRIVPLLTRPGQEWLRKFTWATPPVLSCEAAFVLPAWTDSQPDWQREVQPTLQLAGAVAITNGTYQDVHADWATTHFHYTNFNWYLPDLKIGRPEGGLQVTHRANHQTRDYYFKLHSSIDPQVVLPLLDAGVRRGFDLCEFGVPPVIEGELWGRWFDPESIGFRGAVAVTNVAVRGRVLDAVVSQLNYTNQIVECLDTRVWRGTQHFSVAGLQVAIPEHRTYITNASGTFDPAVIVHMIGPAVAHVMEPYHFKTPPTARVNGYVPMGNPHDADVVFEGGGGEFESLNFRVSQYTAKVIWKNNLLTVTNAGGNFYGGQAGGWAHFVFPDLEHAQFAFGVNVTNARLPALVADVTQKTNNLDGLLTGQLLVTNAWTDNLKSWNGYGRAVLRDGLLWELPVFGVLSKPLDAMMPGVGNSRFTEASATFGISSSVVYSPDLEMRSATMRLQYRGAVDFDGNLNARVIAEPLRDTPVVGSVVSTILSPVARLFAYRITGTMKDPKSEPIYIPKVLMATLSPFQSLGELFSPVPAKTNAPLLEIK
jgi:hypothetical protein